MKLTTLYSNEPGIFPKLTFVDGFNVIFARVKDPTVKDKDSHNLGKTFLITVIDFVLLGGIDKDHPFRLNEDVFGDFVFFLQVKSNSGQFITIKRAVKEKSQICIHVSSVRHGDLTNTSIDEWTYPSLTLSKARQELNSLLDLQVIKPEDYRKGLGYVLRRQSDYDEVFRISKFAFGRDEYWKPFVAELLGFNYDLIKTKYAKEAVIIKLQQELRVHEQEAGSKSAEYDEIKGRIEIGEAQVQRMREQLEGFSFHEVEAEINDILVYDIEVRIAELNRRRYAIDYELHEIENSLTVDVQFDLDKIREVFNEARLEFPEALVRSYEDVVDFNKRMSSGRAERLQVLRRRLQLERTGIEHEIQQLDAERAQAISILEAQQTLEKYRGLQRVFLQRETEVIELRQRLTQLDRAANVQHDIEAKQLDLSVTVQQIRDMVRSENLTYSTIRTTFSDCVEAVLNVQALMSVNVNQNGNLEFNVRTLDRDTSGRETSEALGTSYRKILCACFDIALLIVYSSQSYYRFVYHDGIFEGLDNRKKVNLIGMIRRVCANYGLQYILSVIDSDLPRDDQDQKQLFDVTEIVRTLHDDGDEGRLFRTKRF